MSGTVTQIRDASTFDQQVLRPARTVLVNFYADWCPYCRRFAPTFEKLADEFEGVEFAAVNVDDAPGLERQYDIGKIPSVLLFENGREVRRWSNEQQSEPYREALHSQTASHAA